MTKIELSDIEAERFIEFQKHYKLFHFMGQRGLLDTKGGSVTIHFDRRGEPVSVEKTEHFIATVLP